MKVKPTATHDYKQILSISLVVSIRFLLTFQGAALTSHDQRESIPSTTIPRSGSAKLREAFDHKGTIRIIGAHNPLGARLAERAGFDGIWSSGLEISASQGVPDADILTMTELLNIASSMVMAVDIPVVADCDAGYGNVSNVIHMMRRYEAAGIAGLSIEDKQYPKVNSFIHTEQKLTSVTEFCGKIEAAKSVQHNRDTMVIARIESLIAGFDINEALHRGHSYADSGADAVLIHARGSSADPILEFLDRWGSPVPVVVVPTTYHTITADQLGAAGAKMVIYANHGLRAGINAMAETFATILRDGRSTGVENTIAPLSTVFDLQGMPQMLDDQERFQRSDDSRPDVLAQPTQKSPAAVETSR